MESANLCKLSNFQKRLCFLSKLISDSFLLNVSCVYDIEGLLKVKDFEKSLQSIIYNHESLRTNFEEIKGELVQVIKRKCQINLEIIDLSKKKIQDKKTILDKIKRDMTIEPFDLRKGTLFRFKLIKLKKDKYTFVFVVHHIVFDAWSFEIFCNELAAWYNYYSGETSIKPIVSKYQYKDYVKWEQEQDRLAKVERQEKYWLNKLKGELPVLELPTDRSRLSMPSYAGSTKRITINKKNFDKIRDLCKKEKITLYIFLLTVFEIFLYRLTGQSDLLIGSFVSTRSRQEFEKLIGPMFNNLIIRGKLDGAYSFSELTEAVKNEVLESIIHKDYSFDHLLEKLKLRRDLSRPPIFNVSLQLYNKRDLKIFHKLKVKYERIDYDYSSELDLFLYAEEKNDSLIVKFNYNSDLFNQDTAKQLIKTFNVLLENILIKPREKISDIEIVDVQEKYKLLHEFNNTKVAYPKNKTIHQLFEEQVRKTPSKVAVIFEDKQLTYGELNKKANQLARVLRKNKVKRETMVGIIMERSLEVIIGILAVLKVGGAFVPVDLQYPEKRIKYMVKDTKMPIILSLKIIKPKLKWFKGKILCLDSDWSVIEKEKTDNFKLSVRSSNLACVIYTSGSTGEPKGVMLEHRGIINHIFTKIKEAKIGRFDILCQNLSISFVASIWQFFTPLFLGIKLILYPEKIANNPLELFQIADRDQVTILEIAPSLFNTFLEIVERQGVSPEISFKTIILTGEEITNFFVNKFYRIYKNTKLLNAYGQSECSDDTLHYQIPSHAEEIKIPIGKPSNNTQVYVLGKNKRLLPARVPGEIYISGNGLARGYLNKPKKTKEVFLPHPFIKDKRIYKTGDLGKMLLDGNIEYLGRIDHQVKIRGNRVETGEIEAILQKINKIKDCVVVAKKQNKNTEEQYLVVYYTSQKPIVAEDIMTYLKNFLPYFMIPSYFVYLKKMPLTTSGKIDRLALPELDRDVSRKKYHSPKTVVEKKIAEIWKEILNTTHINPDKTFFDLGGHSLKIIQAVSEMNRQDLKITLSDFLNNPTIKEMAQVIKEKYKHSGR